MKIKIEKPLLLHLDLVEIDERTPSMEMKVAVDIDQFGHRLEYRGCVWLECSVWDAFVVGLKSLGETPARLVDMEHYFTFSLEALSKETELSWEMKKVGLVSEDVTEASFRSKIDEDTLAHIRAQFIQFQRWW